MLEKHYDHKAIEERWYRQWEDQKVFASEPDPKKEPYTVVIPPPNVTGKLHMGHVLNNTLQDILIRYKKMQGFNTCWVPGTDHAGIATQTMVEKDLVKQGIEPESLDRETFLEKVWEWKHEHGGIITKQLRKLGSSCDWDRERFTMDEKLSEAVAKTFKSLYDKGWIYRSSYIVNWCPALQTALSDDEVERSDEKSHMWHFRYPIAGSDEYLIVATTRPETMLGDTGVAVHPEDERYQHLIGKHVMLPIVNREIPIFADTHVDPKFGTGCVKVTPAHDKDDFEMGQANDLETIVILDKRAFFNENVPAEFQGMDRWQGRKAVVAKMEELGFLEKIEDHTLAVGRCYRTKDVIEPYISDQWFVKMDDFAKMALSAVEDGRIKFHPERWFNTYKHWMDNIRDWCISRQLKWGHRIPVWYDKATGEQYCALSEEDAIAQAGHDNLEQDPDVLDTWASSWLWPFSVFDWPDDSADLKYYYPTATLVTAADIIFFWVARMIMSGLEFMGEVPFRDVYFNGIVRDLEGRKMSKTLGNSPDPLDIIEEYGADALRFSIVYNTPFGEDTRFANESCDFGRGFCTKIWNANRFLQMTFEGVEADPNWADKEQDIIGKWILSRLTTTIAEMQEDFDNFRFANAASKIYNFFWGEFCDWYVEFLKPAQKAASETERAAMLGRTKYVVDACLRLLHPFMPFVTEELWHHLDEANQGKFLVEQDYPKVDQALQDSDIEATIAALQELISGIRRIRKTYNLPNATQFKLYLSANDKQQALLRETESILMKMGGLETYTFMSEESAPKGCAPINLRGMSAYLDLRGHLDIPTELAKIDKKLEKLQKEFKGIEGRLNNQKFMAKAPADVVAKAKGDAAAIQQQMDALTQSRADLEGMGDA